MSDLPEEDEGIIVSGRAFKKLLEHHGWPFFAEAILRMIEFRSKNLMRPCASLDAALVAEHEKGIIEGLQLALNMPAATVEEMQRLQAEKYDEVA